MKKIFFCTITAALFACSLFHSNSVIAQPPVQSEEIELTTETKTDFQSEGRSQCSITAYFLPRTSYVEVSAFGAGTCTVSLKNSSGLTISQTVISPNNAIAYLAVPSTPDIFEIIIESRDYYSFGYFKNR